MPHAPRSGYLRSGQTLEKLQAERATWFVEEVARYRRDDVTKVEWLGGDDSSCDKCKALSGKTFSLDDCPKIPVCDDCRCCIAPVVD